MNDTPQGDGNLASQFKFFSLFMKIRMNDTPQGDGNKLMAYLLKK